MTDDDDVWRWHTKYMLRRVVLIAHAQAALVRQSSGLVGVHADADADAGHFFELK